MSASSLRNYHPKKRPLIPLMLWRPHEPIYPRLIKTAIDGQSIEETKEMRKQGLVVPALAIEETKEIRNRGLAVPALAKLAKNGYYGRLVPMVRDALLTNELHRLPKTDYKKIDCKLRDLVLCVLVTFEKEQIVIWRGKDYKPAEDGQFVCDWEFFDDPDYDMVCSEEGHISDETGNQHEYYTGNSLDEEVHSLDKTGNQHEHYYGNDYDK